MSKCYDEKEKEILEQKIYENLSHLAEDINLRLLCETGKANADILYVESIIITGIVYPTRRKKKNKLTPRLSKIVSKIKSKLLKKNKK